MKTTEDTEDKADVVIAEEVEGDLMEDETYLELFVSGAIRWALMRCRVQIDC